MKLLKLMVVGILLGCGCGRIVRGYRFGPNWNPAGTPAQNYPRAGYPGSGYQQPTPNYTGYYR